MPRLSDIELPLLPVDQPEMARDPEPYFETCRRQHEWLARTNVGGYAIHGFHAVRDILGMDDKLRPYFDGVAEFYGAEQTDWGRFMAGMMLARHGEQHHRLRSSVQLAFTPRNINRYRSLMRQTMSDLLDQWAPKGTFDFADFASYFPISVFCGILGISASVVPGIRGALETQAASTTFNRDLLPAMLRGFDLLWDFVDSAVREQERRGTDDGSLLGTMVAARDAGKIDDTELRQNLIMFASGGYDTSKNMLGLIVHMLMQRPDDWQRCATDLPFCAKIVQECLRHSSIASVYRATTCEFEYRDVIFPEKTLLFFMMGLTGRDPSVFTEPLELRPDRQNAGQHLAFGRGSHYCIGLNLAKAQLEEGLHLITQRLLRPKLAGEVTWRPYLGIWGIRSLPIAFEAATF
jgi:cytochrome P450